MTSGRHRPQFHPQIPVAALPDHVRRAFHTKDGDISISDFQREFVWSIKQSSLLIDSFLRGLPVPPVFFYIGDDNKNLVIDGQQRILSVVYFIEGYFGIEGAHGKRQVFRLKGLGAKSAFVNKRFVDLSSTDQRKLKQAVLRAVNIKQLSPVGNSTSAYHIFERLNTGGTPLTSQEIRNCVFMGGFSNQLRVVNKDKNWRLILGKPNIDRHQKDVEILLRVFSLFGNVDSYEKPMKEFLNKAMRENQKGDSNKVKRFMSRLPDTLEMVVKAAGPKPFQSVSVQRRLSKAPERQGVPAVHAKRNNRRKDGSRLGVAPASS
jgi:uncharacterized protein with ParB-like and HNH nuclease domain